LEAETTGDSRAEELDSPRLRELYPCQRDEFRKKGDEYDRVTLRANS